MSHPTRSSSSRVSFSHPLSRAALLTGALAALAAVPTPAAEAQDPDPWHTATGSDRSTELEVDLEEAAGHVDEIFQTFDSDETPGCAVAVGQGGQRLLSEAYGMADLEIPKRNSPSTRFEAGSVSKQFAAAAIILLKQDGEVSLDDDVRDHVPDVYDYGETITIKQLMTHTSGLRDWGSVAAISGWGRSARTHNHHHVVDILSRQSELNFPPGERYSYSNSGYNLMAVIVERATGGSLDDFTQERLFEPLGMTHTSWRDDYREIQVGRAAAYADQGNGEFLIDRPIEHVHGNAALLTTVDDLLTWNRALQTGRVVGDEFVELMHTPAVLNDGREVNYAGGLFNDERNGHTHINHTGATSGYRAYLGRFPESELSVAVLCNVTSANAGGRGGAVANAFLFGDPEGPDGNNENNENEDGDSGNSEAGVEVSSDQLQTRAGYYRSELDNSLLRVEVDEEGKLREVDGPRLTPVDDGVFRRGDGDTYYHFESQEGERRHRIQVTEDRTYEDERYVPVEPWENPEPEELEAFEGTYRSDDAETEVEVRVEDGELVMHRRPEDTFELTPIYEDAFQGFARIRFLRDDDGQVEGFTRGAGRVYDMRFERVDP